MYTCISNEQEHFSLINVGNAYNPCGWPTSMIYAQGMVQKHCSQYPNLDSENWPAKHTGFLTETCNCMLPFKTAFLVIIKSEYYVLFVTWL